MNLQNQQNSPTGSDCRILTPLTESWSDGHEEYFKQVVKEFKIKAEEIKKEAHKYKIIHYMLNIPLMILTSTATIVNAQNAEHNHDLQNLITAILCVATALSGINTLVTPSKKEVQAKELKNRYLAIVDMINLELEKSVETRRSFSDLSIEVATRKLALRKDSL